MPRAASAGAAYKSATGGLSLTGFAILVGGAILLLNLTRHNIYLSIAGGRRHPGGPDLPAIRYAQLSIRRLHDRGLPGWLFWPVILSSLTVLARRLCPDSSQCTRAASSPSCTA
ncbi:MAG: hypothetical protein WDN06_00020 [Asticcacaulis sp.]